MSDPAQPDDPAAAITTAAGTSLEAVAASLETIVARVLVVGTYLAIGLILVGVIGLLRDGIDPLATANAPAFDLGQVPGDIVALRPTGFIWAGILTVMALPILRVIISGAGFYAAGERRLALVSALVVLVVGVSIVAAVRLAA